MGDLEVSVEGVVGLVVGLSCFLKLLDQAIEELPEVRDLFRVTLLHNPQSQRIIHLEILRDQWRVILRQGRHRFPYLP